MALLYKDYIALREGKITEERAKELGMIDYKKGQKVNIIGTLHDFKGGGRMPDDCPYGGNNTADNW
jgi:hypothetical protein